MAGKIIVIIQARETSSRLPRKVLKRIYGNLNVLDVLFLRLRKSKKINKILFAIPNNQKNLNLKRYLISKQYEYFLGPENDVLKRYYLAAKKFKAKHIVRITSDCPLIDGKVLDEHINFYIKSKTDYLTNQINRTYPDGYDIEIFSYKLLSKINKLAKLKEDREHVTTYIKRNYHNIKTYDYKENLSKLRLTIDYEKDLQQIKKILKFFGGTKFSLEDISKFCKRFSFFNKSENLNTGQKTWRIARKIMPPGSMLLSKNPDLFLKGKSPAYFHKAKGCYIWDLDGKRYLDFSFMGVGTNVLGYANQKVNNAISKAIKNGSCSTLNSREDVLLAQKIIDLHPWFGAVRFGRGGAETNAIALRLSRAFTGKQCVAICGYHGWHDWYLSANYKSKGLDNFLFKNVKTKGILRYKEKKSFIFNFNNIKEFKKIINKKNFSSVIMEVKRNEAPNLKFLKFIRNYCTKNNIVLIFDECSSGFRDVLGGYHKKIGIYPDLAMFSKAIGNGYPITVLAGKSNIMKEGNNTFASSTYWSERVGPTAALATIKEMERIKSWKIIESTGKYFRKKLLQISLKNRIKIKLNDSISIISFSIIGKYQHIIYKNFISQEMLKKNIIFSDTVYISVAHNKKIVDQILKELNIIFRKIKKYETQENLFIQLEQDISGINFFQRLN